MVKKISNTAGRRSTARTVARAARLMAKVAMCLKVTVPGSARAIEDGLTGGVRPVAGESAGKGRAYATWTSALGSRGLPPREASLSRPCTML